MESAASLVGNALLILACAAVGLLIVSRRPANPIGWLLALVGFGFALGELAGSYAGRELPGAAWAALLPDPMWVLSVALGGTLLMLLLPTGRLPSPRWRPLAWAVSTAGLPWWAPTC